MKNHWEMLTLISNFNEILISSSLIEYADMFPGGSLPGSSQLFV